MPSIKKMISIKEKEVESGIIEQILDYGRYLVNVRNKSIRALSTASEDLFIGARVLVTLTAEGNTIIAKETTQDRTLKEVMIDG